MYKCVMVIASVYGYIDKQTDGIDRHGDRHKDREIWRHRDREIWRYRAGDETAILIAYYLEFVGLSVYFGCLGCLEFVGSDFLLSIKKFFNFPIFFHNYLIFNAFQI